LPNGEIGIVFLMKKWVLGLILLLVLSSLPAFSSTPPKPGSTCSKQGITKTYKGKKYTCVKSGKKLIWDKGVVIKSPTPTPSTSLSPTPTPSTSLSPTPTQSTSPTPTKSAYNQYELTKIRAFQNIISSLSEDSLKNVLLNYKISESFPDELASLYRNQVEYASQLYGSFFKKPEKINIYLYTEKDEKYLLSEKLFAQDAANYARWFKAWSAGVDREHNLGLAAWYMDYPTPGEWQGHAGLIVYSGATSISLRKYAIQVMPHEYWHVVQDYYFRKDWEQVWQKRPNKTIEGQDFYDLYFPPTFREGSANTISFALASKSESDYLDLYRYFIEEKKNQTEVKVFSTLKSTTAVETALKNMENRRNFADAHEASYAIGSLLYEWVIAEFGFDAYRKLIENQLIGNSFEDNVKASLGLSTQELYKRAAPHILAAFQQ